MEHTTFIIIAILIIAFMVTVIGIRQESIMRDQRKFFNWFYMNINFMSDQNEDKEKK
jgi:hypothetical protein